MNIEDERNIYLKKISSILRVHPEDVEYLEKLDGEDLNKLNERIQDAMYEQQAENWERVAKVVRFFPNFMSAKVSQQVLGPAITANICYHVGDKDLLGISKHLSVPFLTDVAESLIPSKSERVVNIMPLEKTKQVTQELMRRQQYFTAASFIEVLNRKSLLEVIDTIRKESDLIHSAEFVRNTSLLKDIFLRLSPTRQVNMIKASVQLNKENIIINTLLEMENNERGNIIRDFLKNVSGDELIPFFAEFAEHLVSSRTYWVVNELPISNVKKITEYLMEKEKYEVVGAFIEGVEPNRLMELTASIHSESDLIKCAEYVEDTAILKEVFLSLPKDRQTKMLKTAVEIKKEKIVINSLQAMEESERNSILGEFLKSNPEGASAFLIALDSKS